MMFEKGYGVRVRQLDLNQALVIHQERMVQASMIGQQKVCGNRPSTAWRDCAWQSQAEPAHGGLHAASVLTPGCSS